MEDIYTDKIIKTESIQETLAHLFPALSVFHYDLTGDIADGLTLDNPDHIFFNTLFQENKPEFGFAISIYGTPDEYSEERALYIGKAFSERFNLRVLVPFTNPLYPEDPYYDIVFNERKTYLADDNNTRFADNSKDLVRIIEAYPLKSYQFNSRAQLKKE